MTAAGSAGGAARAERLDPATEAFSVVDGPARLSGQLSATAALPGGEVLSAGASHGASRRPSSPDREAPVHLNRWVIAAAVAAAAVPRPAPADTSPVALQDGASWLMSFERATAPEQVTVRVTRRLTWWSEGSGGRLLVEPVSAEVLAGPREAADQAALDFPYGLQVDAGLRPVAFTDKAAVVAATRRWLLRSPRMAQALPMLEQKAPDLVELTAWALAAQELLLLGQAQGLAFGPDRTLRRRGELQNPLGGSPMSGTDTFVLEPFDAQAGRAVVTFRREADPASFRASLLSMIRAFDLRNQRKLDPAELERLLDRASLDLTFACRHELDLDSGLARLATCVRTFRFEIEGRVREKEERWTLQQGQPGPASR